MSLHGVYDDNNVFAKIVQGHLPCAKIYEDRAVLCFMDAFPQTKGHALVILKNVRARNFLDVPCADLLLLMPAVQNLARAMEKALSPQGIRIIQFNGAPAGQTVFHLHMHVIPVYEEQEIGAHADSQMKSSFDELQGVAQKIADCY